MLLVGAAAPETPGVLEIQILKLRNLRGQVHLCVTPDPKAFPDCKTARDAYRKTVKAVDAALIRLSDIRPGTYALAIVHDENGNGKLDTMLGMPKEGFGFSRDAPIRFGPPRYREAQIVIAPGENRQSIKVRYLL